MEFQRTAEYLRRAGFNAEARDDCVVVKLGDEEVLVRRYIDGCRFAATH